MFEAKGYRATTVAAITARAHTAHGTFYLYFRNKEDAFCQVVEAVIVDELAGSVTARVDDGPRRAMEAAIRNFLAVFHRHDGLWRALLEGMLQSARLQELWLRLRRDLVLRLSDTLEAQQRSGAVRPFDATAVAHSLAAMAEWSAFTHLVMGEPTPERPRDPEGLVATLADLWYRAVYGTVPDDAGAGGGAGGGDAGGHASGPGGRSQRLPRA